MVIKLKDHTQAYEEAKKVYAAVAKDENASPEKVEEAWSNMQNELVNSLTTQITNQVHSQNVDQSVLMNRGVNTLTTEERKFFNDVAHSNGFETEVILPETVVDRIFDDLTTDHPLLNEINMVNAGVRTRVIRSTPEGSAVWGPIFGEIKGQLDANFYEETFNQNKLTAFVVLAKDLEDVGPEWIEAYVRAQIAETFAVALENAIINGVGSNANNYEPIGLVRDLNAAVDPTNGYARKAPAGTLTFADPKTTVRELAGVMQGLSTKENGRSINVDGRVVLIVNPTDAWGVKAQYTIQNSLGAFITALPFNLRIVESEFMKAGEVVAFVNNRYSLYRTNGVNVKKFDQTLALEDCNLYTAKTFAYGKADDNNAAAVYTLAIDPAADEVPVG